MDVNAKLSPNFQIKEFVGTSRGKMYIDMNTKYVYIPENLQKMQDFCNKVLEPLRNHVITNYADVYGIKGLRINSGIRCPELNKLIGGSATSQHCHCEAADVYMPNAKVAYDIFHDIMAGKVVGLNIADISQLILERKVYPDDSKVFWLHTAYNSERWAEYKKAPDGHRPLTQFMGTLTGKPKSYVNAPFTQDFTKAFLG